MLPTFEVFGLSIPMFGIMMMCGMLSGFVLLWFAKRYIRFTEDQLITCALWAIILGFLGSKILYWFVELDQVIANPHYLIETLRSGFVFYGALIGGAAGIAIYAAQKKLPFFAFVDLFAPSLVLAQAFGRIGCFCAGCCYGSPSDAWCAVTYPVGGSAPSGVPLLPTQLFESAFLFLLTFVLVQILKKKKPFGTVTGWYFVLYGIWRFVIEFFRSDDRGAVGSLSTSQFLGIFIVLAGVAILMLIKKGVLQLSALPEDTTQEAIAEEEALYEESLLKKDAPAAPEAEQPASEADSEATDKDDKA